MTDRTEVTPEDAARSLADVATRRRQVIEEELADPRRVAPAYGLLIAAGHAVKGLRGRRGHRACRAGILLGWALYIAAVFRGQRVSIHRSAMGDDEQAARAVIEAVAWNAVPFVAQRVVGAAFRRTRLRYPNAAAGVVLGVAMPPLSLAVRRRLVTRLR